MARAGLHRAGCEEGSVSYAGDVLAVVVVQKLAGELECRDDLRQRRARRNGALTLLRFLIGMDDIVANQFMAGVLITARLAQHFQLGDELLEKFVVLRQGQITAETLHRRVLAHAHRA